MHDKKKEASIIIEKGIVIFKVVGNIRFHNVFFYKIILFDTKNASARLPLRIFFFIK